MSKCTFSYSQKFLQTRFEYDPDTGILKYRNSRIKKIVGKVAGSNDGSGYLKVQVDKNKRYFAHTVIWVYLFGRLPNQQVDHINGNRSDNRLINLREVSNRENQCNRKIHREGKLPGYYRHRDGKFQVRIRVNKSLVYLGLFRTELEAHAAYVKYLKEKNIV